MDFGASKTGVMSGTSTILSNIQNIYNFDNHGLQIIYVGTATGTISILVSNDGTNFDSLTFSPVLTQPAGSSGHYAISLNQVPFSFLRVQYVNASGSGSLSVSICSKDLN